MMGERKMYMIGVFDPNVDNSWPWHFHYENGVFLSEKKRLCKDGKAAKFENQDEAREFFHSWSGNSKYKMELIECFLRQR
jgi:hypothetical protein